MNCLKILTITSSLLITNIYAEELPNFTNLIKDNAKVVVKIDAKSNIVATNSQNQEIPELFRYFFDNPNGLPQQGIPKPQPKRGASSHGSGFFIDNDGYILTNAHVVKNATDITIGTTNQAEYKAKLVGLDERTDVALLKIDKKNLPVAKIGNSDKIEVGEWVVAIGSPFGFDYTATKGIVSAVSRSLPDGTYVPFIQTDAAVNPGNSGGPLFNIKGEVIGINSQIYSNTGSFNGLAFAIPINVAMNIVKQLKDKGFVTRGWLGVSIQSIDQDLANSFGLDKPKGALIAGVIADGPAEKAGIAVGDIILSIDNKTIERSSELPPIVGAITSGTTVDAVILRAGKQQTIKIKVGELEDNAGKAKIASSSSSNKGFSVASISKEDKLQNNLKNGVIIDYIEPNSMADRSGFAVGDVILAINGKDINDIKSFVSIVKELPNDKPSAFLVNRRGYETFIALR